MIKRKFNDALEKNTINIARDKKMCNFLHCYILLHRIIPRYFGRNEDTFLLIHRSVIRRRRRKSNTTDFNANFITSFVFLIFHRTSPKCHKKSLRKDIEFRTYFVAAKKLQGFMFLCTICCCVGTREKFSPQKIHVKKSTAKSCNLN